MINRFSNAWNSLLSILYFSNHRVTSAGYELLFVHRENASLVWWKCVKRRKWFVPERRKERSKIKGREAIIGWVQNPKKWCRSGHNQIKVTSGIESTSSWGVLFHLDLFLVRTQQHRRPDSDRHPPSIIYDQVQGREITSLWEANDRKGTHRTLISPEIPGH